MTIYWAFFMRGTRCEPRDDKTTGRTWDIELKWVADGIMFGGYQAIYRDQETGVYIGATEMRKMAWLLVTSRLSFSSHMELDNKSGT